MTFQLSEYQQAVIDWVRAHVKTAGALIVEAVAGSGKTFTIVQAAGEIPKDHKAVFLAFNKSIATELGEKLPQHVESKTLNALGWGVLRYRIGKHVKVDANKTWKLIEQHLPEEALELKTELKSIVGKAKSHGLIPVGVPTPTGTYEATTERWNELLLRYDIDPGEVDENLFINWAHRLLKAGLKDKVNFDFDDQLYVPVALDLPTWGYDWVIIDEAQDVSHVQRTLLRKFLKRNGRLIAVGDSHQAIYGFRGADSQSLANIGRLFKADTLPLSVTYRCPRKVVEIAKEIVPQIECSDTAEDGEVLSPKSWTVDSFSDDDLVICRTTAPLIELAYKCISGGKQVHVLGREIGKGLVSVVNKVAGKRITQLEDFLPKLRTWGSKQIDKAQEEESRIAGIQDRIDCIEILAAGRETVAELIEAIEEIFADDAEGTRLSTIHKAKGLEASRVFILNPDGLPSPWARQEWQQEQENNLHYVAVTRALETLVYLPIEILDE